ncbi:hypothetical protein DENSPDRAFT_713581 [Dentipellis sp. KUC8613]|nr:hypothetical protein DENSPDRAFT_713581 [Dentipellis sp. KUC8613]
MSFIARRVAREVDVFMGFSWRDWSTTLIPGSLFAFGALRTLPLADAVRSYLFLVTWLTPYIYFFNLSNQITGVDEDKINKPDRPIPSGKVTLAGAQRRWAAALSVFVGVAAYAPALMPATLCWILTIAFLILTPGGDHWFGKNNVAMATGTWALLQASWVAIAPTTPKVEVYIYAVSAWAGLITHIQDLRDLKGDIAVGRYTLPIAFGDRGSRLIISFVFIPMAVYVLHLAGIMRLAPVTLSVLHVILMYRVLRMGGPRYDHKTYMFYTYIFCLILAFTATEGMDLKVLGGLIGALDFGGMKVSV